MISFMEYFVKPITDTFDDEQGIKLNQLLYPNKISDLAYFSKFYQNQAKGFNVSNNGNFVSKANGLGYKDNLSLNWSK